MNAPGKRPNVLLEQVVLWRAKRIADPVERLRFLRHTVGDRQPLRRAAEPAGRWWQQRRMQVYVVLAAALLLPAGTMTSAGKFWRRSPVVTVQASEANAAGYPQVWPVEQNKDYETYSNGLRIERRFEVSNEPRSFVVYSRDAEDYAKYEERTSPVGLVFHTTESAQAEFSESKTRVLRIIGQALLEYVQKERAYHYVVDRFGRVWRIVRESDSANHAGPSVWADDRHTYVNLNRSFLGVSVEAQTQSDNAHDMATPAQIRALRVLTEMLRSKYRISAANCATHAQVSVNPANMQAGYHYDWAANFPYVEIGLPNNYSVPAPSLWLFGFTYDTSLVNLTGEPFWKGLLLGEEQLRQNATAHGMSVSTYRKELEKRYRQVLSTLKSRTELSKEKQGEKKG